MALCSGAHTRGGCQRSAKRAGWANESASEWVTAASHPRRVLIFSGQTGGRQRLSYGWVVDGGAWKGPTNTKRLTICRSSKGGVRARPPVSPEVAPSAAESRSFVRRPPPCSLAGEEAALRAERKRRLSSVRECECSGAARSLVVSVSLLLLSHFIRVCPAGPCPPENARVTPATGTLLSAAARFWAFGTACALLGTMHVVGGVGRRKAWCSVLAVDTAFLVRILLVLFALETLLINSSLVSGTKSFYIHWNTTNSMWV